MKNIEKWLLVFTVLFICSSSFAQEKLNFEFDYAQFKNDSTSNLIEFYLYVDKASLKPTDDGNIDLEVKIDIKDIAADQLVVSKGYQFEDVYKDSAGARSIVSVLKYAVPFGEYSMNVTAVDKNDTTNFANLNDSLTASSFFGKSLEVSGIQLASNIIAQSDRETSSFFKNGFEVIPNPHAFYENTPVMFYYSELYFNNVPDTDYVVLDRTLLDRNGRIVDRKTKTIKSFSNDLVDADVINISGFHTGNYFLYLTLFDSTNYSYDQMFKNVYIYNPEDTSNKEAEDDYMSSAFASMSLEECDAEFSSVKYFLAQEQKNSYKNLTSLDGRRRFLYYFWKLRDPDSSTPENEQRIEILQRAEYAREHFRAFKKNGIDSDRGRVYIIYGPPDVRDIFDNVIDSNPYEIWTYHSIEGGVKFIFGDLTGFNDYILIHSTKRGELSDENWQSRIYEVY